jgi:hypothetical protein
MHHECYVIGLDAWRNARVQRVRPNQREGARFGLTLGLHFNDLEAMRLRDIARWGIHLSLDHERLDTQHP